MSESDSFETQENQDLYMISNPTLRLAFNSAHAFMFTWAYDKYILQTISDYSLGQLNPVFETISESSQEIKENSKIHENVIFEKQDSKITKQ